MARTATHFISLPKDVAGNTNNKIIENIINISLLTFIVFLF